MSQSTPIVEYKVFNPDGILHNQGGRSRCTSTSTSSGIQPKWKLAYCRQYFKMHQSLHSRWKLHIRQYGSGRLQGFAGIAIDQDGYCLVGDYDGKSLTTFDSQGNLVHSVQNCPAWGVTLDKEGFVYAADYYSNCVNKY